MLKVCIVLQTEQIFQYKFRFQHLKKTKPEDEYNKIDKAKAEKPRAIIFLRAKDKNGQVKIGLDVFHKKRKNKDK